MSGGGARLGERPRPAGSPTRMCGRCGASHGARRRSASATLGLGDAHGYCASVVARNNSFWWKVFEMTRIMSPFENNCFFKEFVTTASCSQQPLPRYFALRCRPSPLPLSHARSRSYRPASARSPVLRRHSSRSPIKMLLGTLDTLHPFPAHKLPHTSAPRYPSKG